MDLPEDKGTYILWSRVDQMRRMEVGRLGRFEVIPGFYAYVGSAHGGGGLRTRLQHHLDAVAEPQWHIDYLLQFAAPIEIWYACSDRKLEQDWAELLENTPFLRQPIPRFGSSDYRRSRTSHLFHCKKAPSFRWFEQKIREIFAPEIRPFRCVLTQRCGPSTAMPE